VKSIFTDEYELFLRRLISARKEAGMKQSKLANHLKKPQSFVSKYERRERRLDVVEFITICHFLNVDACSIIQEIEGHLFARSNSDENIT